MYITNVCQEVTIMELAFNFLMLPLAYDAPESDKL